MFVVLIAVHDPIEDKNVDDKLIKKETYANIVSIGHVAYQGINQTKWRHGRDL